MTRPSWPPLAGIGDRFLARLIDGLIFSGPLYALEAAFMSGAGRTARLAVGVLLGAFYFVVPVALYGQTPGKAIRRIRVIAADGRHPGWSRAARRYLVEVVGPLLPVFGLLPADFLIYGRLLIADDRRGLHDLFAGTRVTTDVVSPERQR
jgi:uncharacterized RDD family membrane protein YckC